MLSWLTRLFPKRAEAEGRSDAPSAVAVTPPAPEVTPAEIVAVPAADAAESSTAIAGLEEVPQKETCPDCGKTSVFAGPPEHRYCMHCALRQELFDASAAAGH